MKYFATAKKIVQSHGDLVLKKLQRIHKSALWSVLIGRSFIDKIPKGKEKSEEINLNRDENLEFDPNNPRTWSDESLEFIHRFVEFFANYPLNGFYNQECFTNSLVS